MDLVEIEPVQLQMTFDYDSLDSDIREQVRDLIGQGHLHLRRTKEEIIAFGKVLHEVKKLLPHGQFRALITAEYCLPDSTITYAMKKASESENANISILPEEAIEQPVKPVEEVQERVKLRTPHEVVEEWFSSYPNLHHLSNREIAKRCGVTEGTVRNYKKELYPEPEPEPIVIVAEPEPEPEPVLVAIELEPEIMHAPEPEPEPLSKVEPSEEVKQEREARRQKVQERNEQLREKGVELPTETYACLVIDPPWQMQKIEREERPNQFEFDYPTMTEEELKSFRLPNTGDNCHLYLWTTQKHLPSALRLAEHWGFKYQCLMTWVKNVGFTPFSWMYSTEHVLFCTKGSLPLLAIGKRLDFGGKVREHSRKPEEFYDIVKEVSPEPRIDVFSREKRDGFEQYGNEVEKFVSA